MAVPAAVATVMEAVVTEQMKLASPVRLAGAARHPTLPLYKLSPHVDKFKRFELRDRVAASKDEQEDPGHSSDSWSSVSDEGDV